MCGDFRHGLHTATGLPTTYATTLSTFRSTRPVRVRRPREYRYFFTVFFFFFPFSIQSYYNIIIVLGAGTVASRVTEVVNTRVELYVRGGKTSPKKFKTVLDEIPE